MSKIFKTLLLVFSLFVFARPAIAGFGVSPADVYNTHLKPGDSFEKEITLSRSDTNEDLKVVVETDLGEAESWFQFEPGKEFLFLNGQSRLILKIKVNVPNSAELKTYQGIIRIKASSANDQGSGVSIVKGARMEVNLVTTSLNVNTLLIKGMSISEVKGANPIKLLMNIENKGNTKIAPSKAIIEIQNLTQKTIETLETTKLEEIDPNTSKEIIAEFANHLDVGEYFAIVKVYLGDDLIHSDRLVFKVIADESGITGQTIKPSLITKFTDLIENNKVETVAIILIPLIPIAVGLSIYKFGILLFIKNFFITGTIIYAIIGTALLSIYHFQWKPANMAQPGDVGSVQGESIEVPTSTPTSVPKSNSPLKVDQNNTDGYPVYRIPNLESTIVYIAQENEKLQVVDEKDGWYQILTSDGIGGWLPKTSIKEAN